MSLFSQSVSFVRQLCSHPVWVSLCSSVLACFFLSVRCQQGGVAACGYAQCSLCPCCLRPSVVLEPPKCGAVICASSSNTFSGRKHAVSRWCSPASRLRDWTVAEIWWPLVAGVPETTQNKILNASLHFCEFFSFRLNVEFFKGIVQLQWSICETLAKIN